MSHLHNGMFREDSPNLGLGCDPKKTGIYIPAWKPTVKVGPTVLWPLDDQVISRQWKRLGRPKGWDFKGGFLWAELHWVSSVRPKPQMSKCSQSGMIVNIWRPTWLSQLLMGWGGYWSLMDRGQGCCETPYSALDQSLQQIIIQPNISVAPRLRRSAQGLGNTVG